MRLRIIGSFKTLKRTDMLEHIPFPKVPLRLSPELLYRTILMTCTPLACAAPNW